MAIECDEKSIQLSVGLVPASATSVALPTKTSGPSNTRFKPLSILRMAIITPGIDGRKVHRAYIWASIQP